MRNCTLLILLLPGTVVAADRVYPALGVDGRVQLIHSDSPSSGSDATPSKEKGGGAENKGAKAPSSQAGSAAVEKPVESLRAITESGESYQSSEVLEKEGFRPEGKSRFYYVPDGNGHVTIESNAGIPVWGGSSQAGDDTDIPEKIKASPNYKVLDAANLKGVLPGLAQCLSQKQLKKARKIADIRRFSVEAPLTDEDAAKPDQLFSTGGLREFAVRAVSFATTVTQPGYYVPLPVWFDAKGCALAGAWNFWTTDFPASEFRYSSIESVIVPPSNAAYLGFYNPPSGLPRPPFPLQRFGVMTLDIFE